MRKSAIIAVVLALAAAGWIVSGQFGPAATDTPTEAQLAAQPAAGAEKALVAVRVAKLAALPRERNITVSGRTEASREVELSAETSGRIAEVLVQKGQHIEEGDTLVRLAMDERAIMLQESEALLQQREIEHAASKELQTKGFRSETSMAEAQAQLDAARAAVEQMRLDIQRTRVMTPIDGYVWENRVELGSYVKVGDVVATIVDLDPILVVGYATEQEVGLLELGALGGAHLIDGTAVEGIISYIAPKAEPNTRTYRFEMEVDNPAGLIRGGLTAEVVIPVSQTMAHLVSPAVLSLADDGTIGVKLVNADDVVEFRPVMVLGDSREGVWLGGLPSEVTLITVGQEFVVAGEKVQPVPDSAPAAAIGGAG